MAGEVTGWSLETIERDDSGQYTLVWVRCAGQEAKVNLRKYAKRGQWCAQDLPTMCSDSKRDAASRVCDEDYKSLVDAHHEELAQEIKKSRRIEDMSVSELQDELRASQQTQQRLLQQRRELNQQKQTLLNRLGSL